MAELTITRQTGRVKDIAGLQCNDFTVTAFAGTRGRQAQWFCACRCGTAFLAFSSNIRRGWTRNCGCERKKPAYNPDRHGPNLTHGLSNTRAYASWHTAKERCFNPGNSQYARYGARGITMCDEWRNDFMVFFAHMGPCPENLTLDRIDNNGPYTGPCAEYPAGNCRWTSRKIQMSNRRCTIWVTYNGETHTIPEWSELTGISGGALRNRYRLGRPEFLSPVRRQ